MKKRTNTPSRSLQNAITRFRDSKSSRSKFWRRKLLLKMNEKSFRSDRTNCMQSCTNLKQEIFHKMQKRIQIVAVLAVPLPNN